MESQNVEYKLNWRDEWLKTLCAFANTKGGVLKIGVDDAGNPVGISDAKKWVETVPNKIKSHLGLVSDVRIETQSKKDILVIEVTSSFAPISYNGKYYARSGSNTFELTGQELTRFLISKSGKTWDEYPEEQATMDDIDTEAIKQFQTISGDRLPYIKDESNPKTILKKLNLLEGRFLRKAAILLFGKDPSRFYTHAYIKIGKFASDTDVIATDIITGNLFQQVEKAMDILKTKYLMTRFEVDELYRKNILEYPEEALREALINAVIHRNYLGTAHTQLKVYEDKLWLWNEGKLPEGITIDSLKTVHNSVPRNKLLADVFFKASLIETWGRGTIKIVDACMAQHLPVPQFLEQSGGFLVVFSKDFYTEAALRKKGLSARQIKAVLHLKKTGVLTNKDYQTLCTIHYRTAQRDLSDLVAKGILKRDQDVGRNLRYSLNDS